MKLKIISPPTAEPIHLDELKIQVRVDQANTDSDQYLDWCIAAARENYEVFQSRAFVAQTLELTLDSFPLNDAPITIPRPPLIAVDSITYVDTDGATQTLATTEYIVDLKGFPGQIALAFEKSWKDTREIINAVTIQYVAGYVTPFTGATSDLITVEGNSNWADTGLVRVSNSGGEDRSLPSPLAELTDYYVRDKIGDTFKLALTSGGTAVDLTTTGIGRHYIGVLPSSSRAAILLMASHLFENREGVIIGQGLTPVQLPMGADHLAWAKKRVRI